MDDFFSLPPNLDFEEPSNSFPEPLPNTIAVGEGDGYEREDHEIMTRYSINIGYDHQTLHHF